MGPMVVVGAEEHAVGEVGLPAPGPRDQVMGLAPRRRDLAPARAAVLVTDAHGPPLRRLVETPAAAQVEDLGLPTQHGRDDVPGARQASGFAGRDDQAGVGGRGPQTTLQGLEVHRHHHTRRGAAVLRHPGRVEVLQQRAERLTQAGRVGSRSRAAARRRPDVPLLPSAPWVPSAPLAVCRCVGGWSTRTGRSSTGPPPLRDPDPDRRRPVPVDPGGQGRGAAGLALLVLQLAPLLVLTHLGGDDVQDPPAQVPQLPRSERSRRARSAPAPPWPRRRGRSCRADRPTPERSHRPARSTRPHPRARPPGRSTGDPATAPTPGPDGPHPGRSGSRAGTRPPRPDPPVCSATSSDTASNRNRAAATRDSSRASCCRPSAFSAGDRYNSSTASTLSRAAEIASPHS